MNASIRALALSADETSKWLVGALQHAHAAAAPSVASTTTPDSKIGKAHAKYGRPVVGFLEMTPAQHIEAATKELRELNSPTVEGMRIIIAADRKLRAALTRLGVE